ncbi:DedA family protein [Microvirga pudoricolor]|uniref:DedA family protein n=1 Tax=Microvirga pudoricolor TaxID=2778729 RepID=UPI001E4535DE|nr:DedA family protein [Microvirga pudoricolor]
MADIGGFITTHQAWAGPIMGAVAFGESLAFVGLLVPATALMLAVGGMIGTGAIDPVPVLAWAIGGAVLGDAVSYVIGLTMGMGVCRRWPLNRHRSAVARTRLFFRRYGFATIFLGRFLGPIRSTVPLVAGVLRMDHRAFQVANVLSAILWVPLMLSPGYLAAKSIAGQEGSQEADWMRLLTVAILGSILVTWLIARKVGAKPRLRSAAARSPAS